MSSGTPPELGPRSPCAGPTEASRFGWPTLPRPVSPSGRALVVACYRPGEAGGLRRVSTPTVPALVTVVVADDQPLVRSGLRMILEGEPDLQVVGEAENGVAAVALVDALAPDVLLLDVQMPVSDGLQQITASGAPTRVLMLTTFPR